MTTLLVLALGMCAFVPERLIAQIMGIRVRTGRLLVNRRRRRHVHGSEHPLRNAQDDVMKRLLAVLIASTFSLGALAQGTPATPATPAAPDTPASAAPATPAGTAAAPAKTHKKVTKHKRAAKHAKSRTTTPKRAG